jgi:hypothetical protein
MLSYGHPKPPGLPRPSGQLKDDADCPNSDPFVPAVVTPPAAKQTRIPEDLDTSALLLPYLGSGSDDHHSPGGSWNCTKRVDPVATFLKSTEDIFDGGGYLIPLDTIKNAASTIGDPVTPLFPPPKIHHKRDSCSTFDAFLEDMFGDFDSLDLSMVPPEILRLSFQFPDTFPTEVAIMEENETAATKAKKPYMNRKKNATAKKFLKCAKAARRPKHVSPKNEHFPVRGAMEMDVLCGRGEATNRNPGNKEFHKQKAILQPSYLEATCRKDKTAIAQELVDIMQRLHGSRFLAKENDDWYVVDHQRVLEKVKQALRENMTPEERKAKRERFAARNRFQRK